MDRIVYATTTAVAIDEYTCDYLNSISRERLGYTENLRVGVSPVHHRNKVKYKDANWME